MTEFRLSGSGGQGLILAGIILAEAAVEDGREALQSQSYGPEARGGASKSEVIISDKPIYYTKVAQPDVLLAMTQESLDKFAADLKPGGTLVVDSTLVKQVPAHLTHVHAVPITRLAKEELGRELFANIIALGVINKVTGVVSKESLKKAVLARVPKGTEAMNEKALELGYNAV